MMINFQFWANVAAFSRVNFSCKERTGFLKAKGTGIPISGAFVKALETFLFWIWGSEGLFSCAVAVGLRKGK